MSATCYKYFLFLVAVLSFTTLAWSQTGRDVQGKVLSSDGQPLAGVTVAVKNRSLATRTDNAGVWKLSGLQSSDVLVFSYSGYGSVENRVGNKSDFSIQLSPDNKSMDEVVVIGYGTVRRRDLTGAVSSLNAKQLKDIPVNSAADALAGRLAGVRVVSSEGKPGSNYTITVRGGSSITQDNSPLYVIDGIQVEGGINDIAPQDIETIDVLKDAAATAIYGARGANGVIVITTKTAKDGKTSINYNGFGGVRTLANKLEVMSPADFINYQFERTRRTTADSSNFANLYGNDLGKYNTIQAVDWQETVFGNEAAMQTHSLNIGGGSKTTSFNLGFNYNKEAGIMLNSGLDRKMVNFKLDHRATDKFRLGFNVRYNDQKVRGAGTSDEGTSGYNMLRHSVKYRPFLLGVADDLTYDPDYFDASNAGNNLGIINPVQLSNAQFRNNTTRVMNLNGFVNYNFTKAFSVRSTLGVDINNLSLRAFDDSITSNSRSNGASLPLIDLADIRRFTFNMSNVVNFTNAYKRSKHRLDVTAGNEIYNVDIENVANRLRYFPSGISPEKALGQLSLGTAVPLYPRNANAQSRQVSFFARANYGFADRYLLSASVRADGSSKFAEENHWGIFPAVSAAWRVSQESFMREVKFITDLKLRASYGSSGNNRIADYLFLTTYATTAQYALNDNIQGGYASTYLPNKNLKWETNVSRNIGLDFGILNNRLQFSVDVYKNTGDDLLVNAPIASTTGFTTQLQNIGSTSNRGLEIQLTAAVVQKKNFSWNINYNMAFNRNRIERLASAQDYYLQNSGFGVTGQPADFIVKVGSPVGSMYGYVYDGFYTVNDFNYDAATGIYTLKPGVVDGFQTLGTSQPGWMKLKDLNGDNIIDDNDKTIIGNANPKFTGGLNQQFRYKNFDLSLFLNFSYGNTVFNANKIEFTNGYGLNSNMLVSMANRWKTIDQNGQVIQKLVTINGVQVVTGVAPDQLAAANATANIFQPISGAGAFYTTSYAMEDGSFLRVNNLTVGYTLPASLLKRVKISNLRIYATANNLAVFTKYTGYDPDVNTRRATPLTPSVDYSAYPRSKVFLAGINLSF